MFYVLIFDETALWKSQDESWANLAWDVGSDTNLETGLLGCFIDLPSYRPYESSSSRCLAFCHCLSSTVLTDISLHLPFLEQSFLPIISSRLTALSRDPFSAWQTPVYYWLPTYIRGSYIKYRLNIDDQANNVAQVSFGEAA